MEHKGLLLSLVVFVLVITTISLHVKELVENAVEASAERHLAHKFSVQLKSPLYMYSGALYTTIAFVDTPEEEEDIKTLACAEGGQADRHFGTYGMCVVNLTSAAAKELGAVTNVWTEENFTHSGNFQMANYKQRWYAGVNHTSDLIVWYKIPPTLEHYMATNMQVLQKTACTLLYPILSATLLSPLGSTTLIEYVWVSGPIPRCGQDTWGENMFSRGSIISTRAKFMTSWTPVCRWRKTESDLWRIFPTKPKNNVLHVDGERCIRRIQENPGLTVLLPDENLTPWGSVPSLLY